MSDPNLLQWREQFPVLESCNYLVSHSLGAMPKKTYDYLKDYADIWASRGVQAWGDKWFGLNLEVGNKIAAIINAPQDSVTIHQNASLGISILLSALDWSDTKRNKLVITDMIFPTDYYVLREMLPPHIEIVMIKSPDGIHIDTDELLNAIDENTRLVLLSHVLFRSSYIIPDKPIVEKAHQVGAQVLLDGYHSAGVIPVDVTTSNVDYYIGGTLKWMCGGPGGVFLYVRPDLLTTLKPKITGWFAHQRPFDFAVDRIEWREDAYRMLNGTYGVASLYAIQAGIDVIAEVGIEAIRQNSVQMTTLLYNLATEAGYKVKSPADPSVRGGMVVIEPPHAYEVSREMLARNIVIDYRENAGIRVAPHFYNTEDEVQQAIDAMKDIVDSGAWEKHSGSRDFVT